MWTYLPPLRDMRFVMDELLEVRRDWSQIPRFADLDADLVPQILDEAGKFAAAVLEPLNGPGDLEGCRLEAGAVRTPAGFGDAYRRFREAGWPSLACDPESGGQGLPQLLNVALYEMLNSTNHAWTMYSGISHGAYETLRAHASEFLKTTYLPKIVSGEALSSMCLTEPQAGSDLGLLRTRAEPLGDGSHAITGTKIFISGGDHDLTDNILHLVLARLPDAPVGTRGISLFLVPKRASDGGAPNGVRCDGIEKKMGIKGSATCVMSFDGSKGWLIGEPNRGLAAMFVMMNSARVMVGLQGLAHAEMAYQNALRYAAERIQSRAVTRPPTAGERHPSGAEPIVYQPAVRRTLLTLRAFVEGERALVLWCAHLLDLADSHPEPARRAEAHDLVSLLTPVVKAFCTDNGFALSSAALQLWGGYGYVHDYGIEQTVRDSRIAMIYEGTNEIQAVDLLVRKVIGDGGVKFGAIVEHVSAEADACENTQGCQAFGSALRAEHRALSRITAELVAESATAPEYAIRAAADFLRLVGLVVLGTLWARAARIAAAHGADPFYEAKRETAHFYFDHLLPEAQARREAVQRRDKALPWVDAPG